MFLRIMPRRVLSSSAFSSSGGSEKLSKLKAESSSPIASKRAESDFLTAALSSMRLAAMSSTGTPLSPMASEMPITSILRMWSVMSRVVNEELVPESSCMNTNASFTRKA